MQNLQTIRLLVMDLDDTLLDKEKNIKQRDLEAIEKLQRAGVQVAYASGRNVREVELVVPKMPGVFHRICQNGAFVYAHPMELIYEGYFDAELALDIYRTGQESNTHCFGGTAQEMYSPDNSFRYPEQQLPKGRVFAPRMEQLIGRDVLPSKFCFLGEQAELRRLKQVMLSRFSGQVDAFISGSYLDIMPTGVNKGNGIRRLTEHLGMDLSEVACIGDSENDVPMFKLVSHSFVMMGASLGVRAKAKLEVSSVSQAIDLVLKHNESLAA